MALLAGLREVCLHVIRAGRTLEVLQVAADARDICDVVVVVDVALRALQSCMRSRKWESTVRVIERSRLPGCGVVASLAGLGESLLHVIGIICVLEILQVATHARRIRQVVVIVDVALRALHGGVRAGQSESHCTVIEAGGNPCRRGVTLLAGLRESRLHVVGIRRALEIFQMAAHAGCRRTFELIIDVALVALQRRVRADQGKAGVLQMVKIDSEPVVHRRVALFAGSRESRGGVRRTGCVLVIGGVAGIALRRQSQKLAGSRSFVAGLAVQRRVRADQREAILVLLHLLDRDVPSLHGVALLAARAKLTAMNVSVAVGALRAHVSKDHLGMALGASHTFMHTAQRKLGLVVIKLRHVADRLPTRRSVTILAGKIQTAMWTARRGIGLVCCLLRRRDRKQ